MQIHGLTLEFEVHAKEGVGGSRVGYVLAVSPSVTVLKVYFGPTNFYYYF